MCPTKGLAFTDAERADALGVVAAVLHLGNVEFAEAADSSGGAAVCPDSAGALEQAARLLQVLPCLCASECVL